MNYQKKSAPLLTDFLKCGPEVYDQSLVRRYIVFQPWVSPGERNCYFAAFCVAGSSADAQSVARTLAGAHASAALWLEPNATGDSSTRADNE
jgi:hypothetical protein